MYNERSGEIRSLDTVPTHMKKDYGMSLIKTPVFQGETAVSSVFVSVQIGLIVGAAIVGLMTGHYGFPLWIAFVGGVPATPIIGPVLEKLGIVKLD